jgi:hypothetical protein
VIVFSCGSLERIAVRHRASRSLFVSDLIDVSHCTEPKYGALHLNLYMAIVQDARDRVMQAQEKRNRSKKRSRADTDPSREIRQSKRLKGQQSKSNPKQESGHFNIVVRTLSHIFSVKPSLHVHRRVFSKPRRI